MSVRIVLAILALVICAWFALGVRQSISLNDAEKIIDAQPLTTAARARKAESLLDKAATLNPDRQVAIDRTRILLERKRELAARRIITGVTRAEPLNIEAWLWLAHTAGGDPSLYYDALRHLRDLDPLVG